MRNARKVTRRRGVTAVLPVALLVLLAAVFAAGCGSSSSDSTGSSSSGGAKLDVVGYSTPESVYAETLEPAFEKTSEGKGDQLQQLLRRLRRSEPRGRGRPARIGRPLLPGGRHGTPRRRRRTRLQGLGKAALRRLRHGLGRRDPGQEGQPARDQVASRTSRRTTTSKSSPRTRSAPARPAGTSWPSTARRSNEGASPDQALEAVKTRARKDQGPAGQRPRRVRRLQPGRGQRPAHLRERSDQGRKGRRRRRIRRSRPRRSRSKPRSRSPKKAPEPAAEDFLKFLWSDEGQELWAENGYRPVNPKLVDPKQFPTPKDLFKISKFGGWGKVNDEFFDEESGSVAKIEGELGVSTSG